MAARCSVWGPRTAGRTKRAPARRRPVAAMVRLVWMGKEGIA
jgi:hypothetical protein